MTTTLSPIELRIAGCLLVLSFLLVSCGKVTRVRQEEVEERIKREIPVGSRTLQVIAFLDALNINGVKVEHRGYIPGKLIGTDELKDPRHEVAGYVAGWMKEVSRDPSKFQVYSIRMI